MVWIPYYRVQGLKHLPYFDFAGDSFMRSVVAFGALVTMIPFSPAYAGILAAPGPEAGVGLGALAALGLGYA